MLNSAFNVVAPTFDTYRALPPGVREKIRAAVLGSIATPRPRLLDLGAGSGRVGWPFVSARDDYVGADLSSGMLREFAQRAAAHGDVSPYLVQADGQQLPFRDAAFDAVMLIQIFGGLRGWRRLIAEARRVLARAGALILGRTITPPDGVDMRLKQRLAAILDERGVQPDRTNARDAVELALNSDARSSDRVMVATWSAERTPRGFIERHTTGARFAALPEAEKAPALRDLGVWAVTTFGSLDAVHAEPHAFELQVFKFQDGNR